MWRKETMSAAVILAYFLFYLPPPFIIVGVDIVDTLILLKSISLYLWAGFLIFLVARICDFGLAPWSNLENGKYAAAFRLPVAIIGATIASQLLGSILCIIIELRPFGWVAGNIGASVVLFIGVVAICVYRMVKCAERVIP